MCFKTCIKYLYLLIYTREFLRILDTQTVRDSNPKCQIQSQMINKSNPQIEIMFGMLLGVKVILNLILSHSQILAKFFVTFALFCAHILRAILLYTTGINTR